MNKRRINQEKEFRSRKEKADREWDFFYMEAQACVKSGRKIDALEASRRMQACNDADSALIIHGYKI